MRDSRCTCVTPTRWGDPADWQGACSFCEERMEDEERQETFEAIYADVDTATGFSLYPCTNHRTI